MPTPHIESREEDISELVLMPGDPLRAKYIAENFLDNYKLVNDTRNMYFYTGYFKGKRITVAASGMGIPSMGIYAYELINHYKVKKIIRIGTCGSFHKNIKLQDIILSTGAHTISCFPKQLTNKDADFAKSSDKLNNAIKVTANTHQIPLKIGETITSDVFDLYCDSQEEFKNMFKDIDALGVEMESFALFYLANKFNIESAALLTVVDSMYDTRSVSSEERETGLNNMIALALESIIKM
ncbi:MAG: purine-nucleoside phosphorylase [Bacilli bacterium]|nr:purine-nucleoside phosphorylase [Bacilli bacterium]